VASDRLDSTTEFKLSREAAARIFPARQGKCGEKSQVKPMKYDKSKGYEIIKHYSREVLTIF
jgi:hypothetical protein